MVMAKRNNKKQKTELEKAREENAEYAGLLSRWGDLTGNVPPAGVENALEWRKRQFEEHLKTLDKGQRKV